MYLTLNKKDSRTLEVSLNYDGPIKAPVKKGDKVGNIKVTVKDQLVKSIPVYASEDIKKVNFLKSVFMSINYLIWGDV